ncbi:MAG: hypothetical protein ACXVZX_16820 [Terriglobales bacterium]
MRAALLTLFLILGLALVAQQNPDNQQNEPMPNQSQMQPETPSASNELQKGHPLDPHDVDVLTGKSSTTVPASARAVSGGYAGYGGYYPYSANVPLFSGGQFNSTRGMSDQRFFRNFGLFNPRGFLFFGSRGSGTFGAGGVPGRFATQPSGTTVMPGR